MNLIAIFGTLGVAIISGSIYRLVKSRRKPGVQSYDSWRKENGYDANDDSETLQIAPNRSDYFTFSQLVQRLQNKDAEFDRRTVVSMFAFNSNTDDFNLFLIALIKGTKKPTARKKKVKEGEVSELRQG